MMSDPGTNLEIEDVLSSIRRLISQDAGKARGSVAVPHRPAPVEPDPADCLVLTPALRIVDDEAAGEPTADTVSEAEPPVILDESGLHFDAGWTGAERSATPEWTGPADLGDELSRLENTIANMEAAVSRSEVEFEPEEGDRFEAEGAEPLVELPESFDDALLADYADLSPVEELEEPVGPVAATAPEVIEEIVPEAEVIGHEAAPEVTEEAEEVLQETAVGLVGHEEEPAPDPAPQDELTERVTELAAEALAAEAFAGELSEGIWEEADSAPRVYNRAQRLHLSDAEQIAPAPQVRRSSYEEMREQFKRDTAQEPESEATPPQDLALIDEEALRAMVGQMIRDELRGTLGERLTQTLRKLVRREIQRVLQEQDFE